MPYRDKILDFSAEELIRFVRQACGCTLAERNNGPIFIVTVNKELPAGAHRLYSEKEKFFIAGQSAHAALYGIYDLLNRLCGVEFYAEDETDIPFVGDILVPDMDKLVVPSVPLRWVGYWPVGMYSKVSPEFINRMRLLGESMTFNVSEKPVMNGVWGELYAHTAIAKLLPIEKNENGDPVHPEYYSKNYEQVCMTNPAARKVFIENLKKYISAHPKAKFFSLGIEDNAGHCDCENCRESDRKYGGPSGTQNRFANAVAEEIYRWKVRRFPESDFKLCIFAYERYKDAPVVKENGSYRPVHPSVVLNENILVQIAPLDACGLHPITAPCNHAVYERFMGWKAVAKGFLVWEYQTFFDNYMLDFPAISPMAENMRFYHSIGAQMVYSEGLLMDHATGFCDLKTYCNAKLMYNCTLDTRELIENFIKKYYRAAAPFILNYLNMKRKFIKRKEERYKREGSRGLHMFFDTMWTPDIMQNSFWEEKEALKWDAELQMGLEAVREDAVASLRVKREMIAVKYLLAEFGTYYCQKAVFDKRISDFEKFCEECGVVRMMHWGWGNQAEVRKKEPELFIESKIKKLRSRYPQRAE